MLTVRIIASSARFIAHCFWIKSLSLALSYPAVPPCVSLLYPCQFLPGPLLLARASGRTRCVRCRCLRVLLEARCRLQSVCACTALPSASASTRAAASSTPTHTPHTHTHTPHHTPRTHTTYLLHAEAESANDGIIFVVILTVVLGYLSMHLLARLRTHSPPHAPAVDIRVCVCV